MRRLGGGPKPVVTENGVYDTVPKPPKDHWSYAPPGANLAAWPSRKERRVLMSKKKGVPTYVDERQ